MDKNRQKELMDIISIIGEFKDNIYEIQDVLFKESLDRAGEYDNVVDELSLGSHHYITATGYETLLKAYKVLHNIQNETFDHAIVDCQELFIQDFLLRHLKREFKKEILYDRVLKNLQNHSYAVLSYSNKTNRGEGHANVLVYSKENDKYYRSIFNRGSGALRENSIMPEWQSYHVAHLQEIKNNNKFPIFPAIKYPVKNSSYEAVQNCIAADIDNMISYHENRDPSILTKLNQAVQERRASLFDVPVPLNATTLTSEQSISNCTTSSIREFLRYCFQAQNEDGLHIFRDFYDFTSTVTYPEILQLLEAKEQQYARDLNIPLPIAHTQQNMEVNYDHDTSAAIFTREVNARLALPHDSPIFYNHDNIVQFQDITSSTTPFLIQTTAKYYVKSGVITGARNHAILSQYCDNIVYNIKLEKNNGYTTKMKDTLLTNVSTDLVSKVLKKGDYNFLKLQISRVTDVLDKRQKAKQDSAKQEARLLELEKTMNIYNKNAFFVKKLLLNILNIEDISLPIIKDFFKPIEPHLIQLISTIILNNIDKESDIRALSKQLSEYCIADPTIHPIMKAQIIAMHDNIMPIAALDKLKTNQKYHLIKTPQNEYGTDQQKATFATIVDTHLKEKLKKHVLHNTNNDALNTQSNNSTPTTTIVQKSKSR